MKKTLQGSIFNFWAVKLGLVAMVAVLATSAMLSGTLAKYTSEVTGTGSAIIANWDFKAGSTSGATTYTAFKLEDSAKVTKGDVVAERIAPGTTGSLPVFFNLNGTEVATKVTIEVRAIDPNNLPSNLKFKNGSTNIDPTTSFQEVYSHTFTADQAKSHTETSTNVTWEWPFETGSDVAANDVIDTGYGKKSATDRETNFEMRIVAQQIELP